MSPPRVIVVDSEEETLRDGELEDRRKRARGRRSTDEDVRRNRRLLIGVYILVCLNWLHDLGVSVEMFDWWDGREEGLLSTALEQELAVLGPLFAMIFVPIIVKWLDVYFRKRK